MAYDDFAALRQQKKQSQFKLVLSSVEWSQMPAFSRKSEALSTKSETILQNKANFKP